MGDVLNVLEGLHTPEDALACWEEWNRENLPRENLRLALSGYNIGEPHAKRLRLLFRQGLAVADWEAVGCQYE